MLLMYHMVLAQAQLLKAIKEAESYHGPSIVIAYSPCINHGVKKVWVNLKKKLNLLLNVVIGHYFRFDPRLARTR